MLAHYRDNPRIMHSSGTNQQFDKKIGEARYYFSAFSVIWGLASWRRVWQLYDFEMSTFPEIENKNTFKNLFNDDILLRTPNKQLRFIYEKTEATLDHQLGVSIAANKGLYVALNNSFITNIGIQQVNANNKLRNSAVSKIPAANLEEDFTHLSFFVPNRAADLHHIT